MGRRVHYKERGEEVHVLMKQTRSMGERGRKNKKVPLEKENHIPKKPKTKRPQDLGRKGPKGYTC